MIQDVNCKMYLINGNDIRMIDALTRKTSRITWKDNTTTEIEIELPILIEKITGIKPSPYIKGEDIIDESVDILSDKISTRTYYAIKRAGLATIRDLTCHTYSEIAAIRNCGKASATEIENALDEYGLMLVAEL